MKDRFTCPITPSSQADESPLRALSQAGWKKTEGDANPELPTKSSTEPKISDCPGQELKV
jgi:hypothetical protein